jgi:hypothetical protein
MRRIFRSATCGLLLLATPATWAQTVIRVAPPAPVRVGVVGDLQVRDTSGLTVTIAGAVAGTFGCRAHGCGLRTAEPSGYNPDGSPAEVDGHSTEDTGDDEVLVLREARAPTLKIAR